MPMLLDISTLVILAKIIGIGLGLILIVFSVLQPDVRGVRLWGLSMLASGVAYTLLQLYVSTQFDALLYAGWIGLLASGLMICRALNQIYGVDVPPVGFNVAVIAVAILSWVIVPPPNLLGGSGTVSILLAVIAAKAAWDGRGQVQRQQFVGPILTMVAFFGAMAATLVLNLLRGGSVEGDELTWVFGPPVAIVGWTLGLVFLTVGVLWLEFARLHASLEAAAMLDALTGIGNRRAIIAEIESEHSRSARAKSAFGIAIFDIDNFKLRNEKIRKEVGDQILKWVADGIRRSIRPYDRVGRYGGEAFLLMMPGASEKESLIVTERVRQTIQKEAMIVGGQEIKVSVSIGIAVGECGADLDSVLFAADDAIGRAMDRRPNSTVVAPLLGVRPGPQGAV
ncbi:MAG: GGDEF domain-containing protein [Burkholderiales bacterium]